MIEADQYAGYIPHGCVHVGALEDIALEAQNGLYASLSSLPKTQAKRSECPLP
jgi:hypothetical protein